MSKSHLSKLIQAEKYGVESAQRKANRARHGKLKNKTAL